MKNTPGRLCEVLKIDYPIIQGGMAWVSKAELAAAVSNAGGLGIIGSGNMPPEILRNEIRKAKEFTSKPFGVNVILLNPDVDKLLEVILEENVSVVTMGAGDPASKIKYLKQGSNEIKVVPVVPTVALARRAEKNGADAIVAEGTEAGGHIGDLSTMVLVPLVSSMVSIPVIAAGGIADGRGFAAGLALGASGIQLGTRFIASEECTVHPNYKEAIVKARDRDTIVTGRSINLPCRVIKNEFTREYQKKEKEIILLEGEEFQNARLKLEEYAIGRLRLAAEKGDMEQGSVMAGQSAALVNDTKPVKQIINDIMEEAQKHLKEISHLGEAILEI